MGIKAGSERKSDSLSNLVYNQKDVYNVCKPDGAQDNSVSPPSTMVWTAA
jgi:hypothetical protein